MKFIEDDSAAAPRALPEPLRPLVELALDLRWTWSHAADDLWRALDPETWESTRNAWFVLQNTRAGVLDKLASDGAFLGTLHRLVEERRLHLSATGWCAGCVPSFEDNLVVYFCMEFGLGEAIPLYAGGLGILAGDYLKAVSDLGLPLVGVGILFQEGYFRQMLDADGWQEEGYPYNDPTTLPLMPLRASDGAWMRIPLEVNGRTIWLRAWLVRVGRIRLYLLDANDPLNSPADRAITAKLYGGPPETRLLQELILGIGGWRLIEALGLSPTIAHLNEGHAAFAVVERARSFMLRASVSFAEALLATRAGNVFTTHTPIAAGFDRFEPRLIERNILSARHWFPSLGISPRDFLALGRVRSDDTEPFNVAYLAMRGCAFANGVSRLHGEVSRKIFSDLFPRWPEREVPIDHITNGVHVPSWDSRTADQLWTQACGKERWRGSVEALEPVVAALSDEHLWSLRSEQRGELVVYARRRLAAQLLRRGTKDAESVAAGVLDPSVLTLGFARRFTEYKRPNLLLRDPERLLRLLCRAERPAQLVVAGKAHPADEVGKRMIKEWIQFVQRAEARQRVVFLEDYDIALAEQLTQGVDAWINTPRRPWEACGTSGMKVLVNGGLNLSIRDGWWAEADAPDVGWGLVGVNDRVDAEQLYSALENEVVPAFYDRDAQGMPRRWLQRIRASMSRLTPRYSANRMLREYLEKMYVPAGAAYRHRSEDRARVARDLACWKQRLEAAWSEIRFGAMDVIARAGGGWRFHVWVSLGNVPLDFVRVELYADPLGDKPAFREVMLPYPAGEAGLYRFECAVTAASGRPPSDFTPRLLAFHPDARLSDLPLVLWQR